MFSLRFFQTATRVTTAPASAQVKTVLAASGWQTGERGWHAKTWRSKKMREAGLKAGNRGTSEKEEEEKHNTTMIVVADHLPFCSSLCNPARRPLQTADCLTCRFYYIRAAASLRKSTKAGVDFFL